MPLDQSSGFLARMLMDAAATRPCAMAENRPPKAMGRQAARSVSYTHLYHFTTLYPNLGVVWVDEGVSFVMADIPGIIEGASEGAGLGHDFLRHIDRCRLLVHVVDVSGSEGRDPVADFDAINAELEQYSPDLAKRPQIVAANKVDIMTDPENLERLRAHVEGSGVRVASFRHCKG